MEESFSFVPLLVFIALAFIVLAVLSRFRRLRLPFEEGEILAGIVVGNSGPQLVGHDPVLEILALLGFAYLTSLPGLEVDFDAIMPRSGALQGSWQERLGNPLSLGALVFALTVTVALLSAGGCMPWVLPAIHG